jgi:hypothetical protein
MKVTRPLVTGFPSKVTLPVTEPSSGPLGPQPMVAKPTKQHAAAAYNIRLIKEFLFLFGWRTSSRSGIRNNR